MNENFVSRTVSLVGSDSSSPPEKRSLQDFEDIDAYVLLGAPGAGKRTEFQKESERVEQGKYITARDFITIGVQEAWKGKTLFIDGLDELRAHPSGDPRTPLDQVRAKLEELGAARYRLSCREADWLGASDHQALRALFPGKSLALLRLNPLTEEDVALMAHARGVLDFAQEARERGLSPLLGNPLTLILLLNARARGDWPETLTEVFQKGCEQLSKEHNDEHLVANPMRVSSAQLLSVTGHLCAVILIAGLDGVVVRRNSLAADVPSVYEFSGVDPVVSMSALGTLLFDVHDGVARPAHRQFAEFLAAGYLAQRLSEGLSPMRILGQLTDSGDRVAASLRGLGAWLAALCPRLRRPLMDRDPIGVVSYGDVGNFSVSEKQELLSNLEKYALQNPWVLAREGDDPRWGFLATSDMEEAFRSCLVEVPSNETKQWLSYALLDALCHAPPLPGLFPVLTEIVESEAYPVELKLRALEAYRRWVPATASCLELTRLLDNVMDKPVCSGRARLVDLLLTELYPNCLTPSDLPKYLILDDPQADVSQLSYFWELHVLEESGAPQLAQLLDGLVALVSNLNPDGPSAIAATQEFGDLFCRIFAGLLKHGGPADHSKLYSWLEVATKHYEPRQEFQRVFLAWIEEHPSAYMNVVRRVVAQSRDPDWDIYRMLDGVLPPREYPLWCLKTARNQVDSEAAEFYLREAVRWGFRDRAGREAFRVEAQLTLAPFPRLSKNYARILESAEEASRSQQEAQPRRNQLRDAHRQSKREANRMMVKSHETALRENRAPPDLLNQLARVASRPDYGIHGATSEARLMNYLNHDFGLVDTVFQALRETPRREDLPRLEQILDVAGTDEYYYVAGPYLLGLEACLDPKKPFPIWFDETEILRALAFWLATPAFDEQKESPNWYQRLLESHPRLVADVFQQVAKRYLNSRLVDFPQLYELSSPNHREVADAVVLPFLRGFPQRVRNEKLGVLRFLMEVVWDRVDRSELLELVASKLMLKSLMPSQRIYWACFGLVLDGEEAGRRLRDFLSGKGQQRLLPHLIEFLSRFKPLKAPGFHVLTVEAKALLIRLVAPSYRADWHRASSTAIRSEVHGSVLVNGLINALAQDPKSAAGELLLELSDEESLSHLRERLRFEEENHRRKYPQSGFEHLSVKQACEFLKNKGPANVTDLAAIAIDHIDELRDEIRNGDTSDWQQYWEGTCSKGDGSSGSPLDENACRDRFVSDLRHKLENPFRAEIEVHHADGRRSDVRISHGNLEIPIEAKKSHSEDLWTAIEDQLIPKYSRSPSADGYGVYLVFWFGKEFCKGSPNSGKAESPGELQEQLEASISSDLVNRILVRVIDVSRR